MHFLLIFLRFLFSRWLNSGQPSKRLRAGIASAPKRLRVRCQWAARWCVIQLWQPNWNQVGIAGARFAPRPAETPEPPWGRRFGVTPPGDRLDLQYRRFQ